MDPTQGSNGAVGTGGGRTGTPAIGAGHVQRFVPSCEPNAPPPQKSDTLPAHFRQAGYCEINCLGEEMGGGQSVILFNQDHPPALNHIQFSVLRDSGYKRRERASVHPPA
jgi:hypothetical protein